MYRMFVRKVRGMDGCDMKGSGFLGPCKPLPNFSFLMDNHPEMDSSSHFIQSHSL